MTQDHLGSPRIITDNSGSVVSRHDYRAFGDEILGNVGGRTPAQKYGAADEVRQQYTGYERDTESGLDYAQARYYNSSHGRFTSVDPLTASATIRDPQTFNRYSYVLNSPYKFTDPLGLLPLGGSACGQWCQGSGPYLDGSDFRGRDASLDWMRGGAVLGAAPPDQGVADKEVAVAQPTAQAVESPPPFVNEESTNVNPPILDEGPPPNTTGPYVVSEDKLKVYGSETNRSSWKWGKLYQEKGYKAGECPALPKFLAPEIGPTTEWVGGQPILGEGAAMNLKRGTVVAAFDPVTRKYGHPTGQHAAIYLSAGVDAQGRQGIYVVDQWVGRDGSAIRFIPALTGAVTDASNDARSLRIVYRRK